jgi:hypothetical protein
MVAGMVPPARALEPGEPAQQPRSCRSAATVSPRTNKARRSRHTQVGHRRPLRLPPRPCISFSSGTWCIAPQVTWADGMNWASSRYDGCLVPLGESLRLGRTAVSADVAPCRFDASTEPL